ncbi:MAG: carbohydrate kinase [Hyphomicrobiales bacterium]|nr:carbohydrate kinase [Hyphomicrobiales bacterium]
MTEPGRYLLGLDAGNTVTKAVLFDLTGRQVARSARDGASSQPHPGHVERDLDELWSSACVVIRDCLAQADVDPGEILAIGCAGHGNGLYLLDADGAPLLGIQSLDTRAADMAENLSEKRGEVLHGLCLQKPWPSQTATVLAWVREHRPDLYARAGTAFLCKDYITYRLTGERVSDISDMSGGGLLRMPETDYDDRLLDLYGIADARDKLPRLIGPTDIAGRVSAEAAAVAGLAPGIPVVGGLFDVVASALGSGVVRAGQASIIAGTWSINQVFSDTPGIDPDVFMVSGFGPARFVSIDASATSAANLEWYVREFVERGGHPDDPFGFCNDRIATVTPHADDPYFHPFLYGSGQSANARAGFSGLAGWHTEGHVLRALFEGVVFEHRRHIEVLVAAGVAFDSAVMSGGGTRSPHWPQMMADCLGVPITVADCHETGALGAAIAAGIGSELFADYEQGVAAMTRKRAIFKPDGAMKAHYDRRYRIYLDLIEVMGEFWAAQKRMRDEKEYLS